jgi:hypothetical protein
MKKGKRMIKDIKLTKASSRILRYDKGMLPSEVSETEEGYIKGRAIVTRCGVFLYKNADGTIRKELRTPEEVTQAESMETIKMIPIVDGHPPEKLVNAGNIKRLAIGYTGETIEDEYPYIIANMVVTDKAAVEKIKDKKRNQLSLGYTVDLIPESGIYNGEPYDYVQKNIRYNHLALVDEARAGPEARIALDGEDAIEIYQEEAVHMASKTKRKIKIDTMEYMVDDEVANHVESMMKEKMRLEKEKQPLEHKMEAIENELDRAHAERDSMRDKDHHNPNEEHEGREEDRESEGHEKLVNAEVVEKDEIGPKGKEEIDPIDSYGMQSHVRDYEPPSHMRNHVVSEPKNKHYPHDLPHMAKVDQADVKAIVKARVLLEKKAERYLDKATVARVDSLSDMDIKRKIILSIQKNAQLDGKSDAYINARFYSVMEDSPREKVLAQPARMDENFEKDQADQHASRLAMIRKQKEAYKRK